MFSSAVAKSENSNPHSELDDRRLIHETLAGSQAAFQSLVEKYQERIFRLLQRFTRGAPHETEDLAQDVFLKVFRRLHTFHFDSAFYTWVYRIAINTATDHVHRKRRSPVQAVEDPGIFEKGEAVKNNPGRGMMDREFGKIAQEVLEKMPENYRLVLQLREFEELSYEEIAKIMNCAMGTVESRLFRARSKFRQILIQNYPEYAPGDEGIEGGEI